MKYIYYILIPAILFVFSTDISAQTNPVYGSSSSRGVSEFTVPGKASIGYSEVSRFEKYSTGVDRFRPRSAIVSPNPLRFSNQATNSMPKSSYGSVKRMTGQVHSRISSPIVRSRVSQNGLSNNYNQNSSLSVGTTKQYYRESSFSSRFPLRIRRSSNSALKSLTSTNASILADRNKRLLQGNKRGRLSYSKIDIKRSILNRNSKINSVSKLSTAKYTTSSILNNR